MGAIEAHAAGGSAIQGALISSGAELVAPKIAEILYGKTESELNADEKANIISLISLGGELLLGSFHHQGIW